eukprot:Cvel_1617.t1-p1 / transcript=Cvel_1617.t1 / gene=Cvel_1617 / organism=Chromera_velia_CCMP2878 / gene_product=Trafficking protein particle complex subunit 2-like, putative / transcript_product=Trafficking protein particle complex subunit 2-like, putative / location=Cvel_scaffold58:666-2858(-) / protein_length=165 / sequence_SO=supercontig / SO=protein_coding / is_pseudo=false
MTITCVAILGRENQPLCIRCFGGEEELSLHCAAYAAVDILEEKIAEQAAQQGQPPVDPYLGFLCPAVGGPPSVGANAPGTLPVRKSLSEQLTGGIPWALPEYRVYAYVTATGVRILCLIFDRGEPPGGDQTMRNFFRQVHKLYADVVTNPFGADTIETPSFSVKL